MDELNIAMGEPGEFVMSANYVEGSPVCHQNRNQP